jgi:hypothetical protein
LETVSLEEDDKHILFDLRVVKLNILFLSHFFPPFSSLHLFHLPLPLSPSLSLLFPHSLSSFLTLISLLFLPSLTSYSYSPLYYSLLLSTTLYSYHLASRRILDGIGDVRLADEKVTASGTP